jgi:uncharacterized Zn-binding protein involved in type VI secretion
MVSTTSQVPSVLAAKKRVSPPLKSMVGDCHEKASQLREPNFRAFFILREAHLSTFVGPKGFPAYPLKTTPFMFSPVVTGRSKDFEPLEVQCSASEQADDEFLRSAKQGDLMFNAAVRDGDSTTTGGRVFGSGFPADGRKVALDGDEATCGECPGKHLIRGSRHGAVVNGRAMVREGDSVMCPCGKNRVGASFSGIVFEEVTTHRQQYRYGTDSEHTSQHANAARSYDEQVRAAAVSEGYPYFIEMADGRTTAGRIGYGGVLPRMMTGESADDYTVYWGDDALVKADKN